jgi:hypothetical protein
MPSIIFRGSGKAFTLINLPLYYAGNWKPAYEKVASGIGEIKISPVIRKK